MTHQKQTRKARRSVAGGFDGFEVEGVFFSRAMLDFGSGDEDDREDDDDGTGEHIAIHLFAMEDAAEDEGNDGIDVCVGRHLGNGNVLEQPDVGGEADERPGEDEIDDGPEGAGSPGGAVEVSEKEG